MATGPHEDYPRVIAESVITRDGFEVRTEPGGELFGAAMVAAFTRGPYWWIKGPLWWRRWRVRYRESRGRPWGPGAF